MSIVRLLYIDDNRIDAQIERLRKKLQGFGITLQETFLNLGNNQFKKKNEDGKFILDYNKIKEYIIDNFFDEPFDIIISDYDFKDDKIDGYKLISWIKHESDSKKKKIRRAKFCLYSAQQDKIVQIIDTPEKIKKLVRLKIDDFISRDRLSDDLFTLINKEKSKFNFSETLIKFMSKYPDLVFNSVYPKYKGKKLSDISIEIEKDLPNGIDFQKSIVELTITHLIALNNYEVEAD